MTSTTRAACQWHIHVPLHRATVSQTGAYSCNRRHPERFVALGIDPPKGVLLYGPPGTGKTLLARAVANRTDACFIRVIGSELVQKYVGEGARMVRELFQMARSKKACIVFFDEVDAIGGARFDDGAGPPTTWTVQQHDGPNHHGF